MSKFIISNIPMPPSSNSQYWAKAFMKNGRPFGVIAPSRDLDDYVKLINEWKLKNLVLVSKAKQFVRDTLLKGKMLRVDTYAAFPHSKLITKDMRPKRLDATNRIKALHDCIADVLQVDDSLFWSSYIEKIETKKDYEFCIMVFKEFEPRGVSELTKESV